MTEERLQEIEEAQGKIVASDLGALETLLAREINELTAEIRRLREVLDRDRTFARDVLFTYYKDIQSPKQVEMALKQYPWLDKYVHELDREGK